MRFKYVNEAQKSKIQRLLYGYKDSSNREAYVYQREGILSKLLHKRIDQRVILVLERDENKVISILRENKAKLEITPIDEKEFIK